MIVNCVNFVLSEQPSAQESCIVLPVDDVPLRYAVAVTVGGMPGYAVSTTLKEVVARMVQLG